MHSIFKLFLPLFVASRLISRFNPYLHLLTSFTQYSRKNSDKHNLSMNVFLSQYVFFAAELNCAQFYVFMFSTPAHMFILGKNRVWSIESIVCPKCK